MTEPFNKSGTLYLGMEETNTYNSQGLVAKVEPITDHSFLGASLYLKNLFYEKNIDVICAELHEILLSRLNKAVEKRGYPLDLGDIAHIGLIFQYIHDQRIETHFGEIKDFPCILKKVKHSMEEKNQHYLYQICMEPNKDDLERMLKQEGFRIIPTPET